jgi:two-component system, NarL family, sensor histidine kinase UhpB
MQDEGSTRSRSSAPSSSARIQNSAAPIRDAAGSIIGAVMVAEDVTDRVRAEQAVRDYASRLQQLSRRLLAVQEDERHHLSRELHDEFGQLLATISLHLHAAHRLASEAARPGLEECMTLLERAGAQLRTLAVELRPVMLESAGLEATLRWLAQRHGQQTGIVIQVAGHLPQVPGHLAIAGFRMVQEALTNVLRHARAQSVRIDLHSGDTTLELTVRDDGVGFDVPRMLGQAAGEGHLGLLGMRERAQILGGSVEVQSEPGQGARVRILLPFSGTEVRKRGGNRSRTAGAG